MARRYQLSTSQNDCFVNLRIGDVCSLYRGAKHSSTFVIHDKRADRANQDTGSCLAPIIILSLLIFEAVFL